jgi:hypothetical protein
MKDVVFGFFRQYLTSIKNKQAKYPKQVYHADGYNNNDNNSKNLLLNYNGNDFN